MIKRYFPLLLLLAGCVSQLATMKDNASKGDPGVQANAALPLSCAPKDAECYQLHLLKGDACYALSRRTTGAERRANDACAAEQLDLGVAQAPAAQTPVGSTRDYAEKRLEVLRDLIDTRRAGDPSGAEPLGVAAAAFRQNFPDDPAGPFYLGSAQMTAVQDRFLANHDAKALCPALPEIAGLADECLKAPGGYAANCANLKVNVADMKRVGGCP